MDRKPLASTAEVSEYLGIPVATLHQWSHKGTGPKASKVGRWLRYAWADVDAFVAEQQAAVGQRISRSS